MDKVKDRVITSQNRNLNSTQNSKQEKIQAELTGQ